MLTVLSVNTVEDSKIIKAKLKTIIEIIIILFITYYIIFLYPIFMYLKDFFILNHSYNMFVILSTHN